MSAAEEITNGMAQWLADLINSKAREDNTSDFVLDVEGNRIAYVDVEDCSVWLITVQKAKFVPAGGVST